MHEHLHEEGKQLYHPLTGATRDTIRENITTDTDSFALYAEGTWRFTERWSATLGGRWTLDEKKYTNNCSATIVVPPPNTFPTCLDLTFTPTDWSLALEEEFVALFGKEFLIIRHPFGEGGLEFLLAEDIFLIGLVVSFIRIGAA